MHHRLPVQAALTTSFYAAAQEPADARRLFEAGCAAVGFDRPISGPLRASRAAGSSLLLAREWGLDDVEQHLVEAIEASYEPTWDDASGEFTWGLGLDEPHPRGQFNAFLAAAEASGAGRWESLSAAPLPTCPQVVDVDVPDVVLSVAEWHGDTLRLRLDALHSDPSARTQFRIVGVEPRVWWVSGLDNVTVDVRANGVVVRLPRVSADLEFNPSSY